MVPSAKPTAPKYGFGTSTRKAQEKVYQSKALVKSQFLGKTSPGAGADYHYEEAKNRYTYKKDPAWKFGGAKRNTLDVKAKYDHYYRIDRESEVDQADKQRRNKAHRVKFGTSKRFKGAPRADKATPGPKYDPPQRQNFKNTEKYSFGVRREIPGQSPIAPLISTGKNLGPGSYFRTKRANKDTKAPAQPLKLPPTSKQRKFPKHAFPQQIRFGSRANRSQRNQTYETYRSIGRQLRSYKKTEPGIHFTKAKRAVKTGMFKDMMATQPTRVRIPHPKF